MPKFVIEREVPGAGALSPEQLRDVSLCSLEALGELGPRIQWLHSFVTDDKVYCVYLAPDEETIRKHAQIVGFRRIASRRFATCSIRRITLDLRTAPPPPAT